MRLGDKLHVERGTHVTYVTLTFQASDEVDDFIERLEEETLDSDFSIEVKKKRKKRSLDQNAYFWVLIKKLAKKLQISHLECYKSIVRNGNEYEITPIREDVVDKWIANWQSNGSGWCCEILGNSKFQGYVNVKNYFGISTYNSQQMAQILDILIDSCKEQGIEVMSPQELAHMRELEKGAN